MTRQPMPARQDLAARQALSERQSALLAALVLSAPLPPGFDPSDASAAAGVLRQKGAVRRSV